MEPSPCFDLTANPGLAFSFLNPRPAYYDLTAIGFETPMVNLISEEEGVIEDMADTTDTMSVLELVSDPCLMIKNLCRTPCLMFQNPCRIPSLILFQSI